MNSMPGRFQRPSDRLIVNPVKLPRITVFNGTVLGRPFAGRVPVNDAGSGLPPGTDQPGIFEDSFV